MKLSESTLRRIIKIKNDISDSIVLCEGVASVNEIREAAKNDLIILNEFLFKQYINNKTGV